MTGITHKKHFLGASIFKMVKGVLRPNSLRPAGPEDTEASLWCQD